jgi:hypothetical protein
MSYRGNNFTYWSSRSANYAGRHRSSVELASGIAKRLDCRTEDVRNAVRVVRLAPQLGVENVVKLLLGE